MGVRPNPWRTGMSLPPREPEHVRTYLVVLRHDRGALPIEHLAVVVERLRRISIDGCERVFTSEDGGVVGMVLRVAKPAPFVRGTVDARLSTQDHGFVLVLELGDEMAATGNSSGWRHVQRMLGAAR